MKYDVFIIGAGAAGLSAAIYTARAGLRTAVLGKPQESGMYAAAVVHNYPGFPRGIAGPDLTNFFIEQAKNFGTEVILGREVVKLEKISGDSQEEAGLFRAVDDKGDVYESRAVIIATGRVAAHSAIEGEDALKGKGVHYCATCDAPLYKDKRVAVIGSGNYAYEEAHDIMHYTKNVTVISHSFNFEGNEEMKQKLEKDGAKFVNARVKALQGTGVISAVALENGEQENIDAVFLAMGSASAFSFAQELGLEMQDNGLIKIDPFTKEATVGGVYAAGACTEKGYGQISKSVGEGTAAAIAAIQRLRNINQYIDHS